MTTAARRSAAGRWLPAASYAALAVVSFVRPALVPGVFGGAAPTAAARSEVRAVYAGTSLAVVRSLLTAPGSTRAQHAAVVRVARDVNAGMLLARLASCVVERRLAPWPTGAFLALETTLAVALEVERRRTGGALPPGA